MNSFVDMKILSYSSMCFLFSQQSDNSTFQVTNYRDKSNYAEQFKVNAMTILVWLWCSSMLVILLSNHQLIDVDDR